MIESIVEAQSQLQEATQPFGNMLFIYFITFVIVVLLFLFWASRGGIPPRI